MSTGIQGGGMSTICMKRLIKEQKRMNEDPPEGVNAAPWEDNLMLWDATITGPPDSPWEGGQFKLTLQYEKDYPHSPPTVKFVSNIFHPNVSSNGGICLDILGKKWSPSYDVARLLLSIQSLLCDPNPYYCINEEAAHLYLNDCKEYERRVRQVVAESTSNI